jgi:group I intron endonuclease
MKIFIYRITSPSGRIYIGKSKNVKNRWADYKRLHCKSQTKLYNSFNKYGVENHIFEVIDEVPLEESNTSECYYISLYDSCKNGLNCTKGGEGNIIFCEETINKLKKLTPWIKGNK